MSKSIEALEQKESILSPEGVVVDTKPLEKAVVLEDKEVVREHIHNLEDEIEEIQNADAKIEYAKRYDIPPGAIGGDVSMAGASIEERKQQIQELKQQLHSTKKHWWQKAPIVVGMLLTGLFAAKDASGQNQDRVGTTTETVHGISKEKTNHYDPKYYTPESPDYNPLKVFQDLSLEFHPERVDSLHTGIGGGDMHPLLVEMEKILESTIPETSLFPQDYKDFESFRDSFIKTRKEQFSNPKFMERSYLHDAYHEGKAIFYRKLLAQYENDFAAFKRDRPKEAGYRFSDFDAGLAYNRTENIEYESEEGFKEAINAWRESAQSVMDELWELEYQKDHLEEEARARWETYEKERKLSPEEEKMMRI